MPIYEDMREIPGLEGGFSVRVNSQKRSLL